MITLPQVTVVGTLTGDPELRFLESGKAVATVNIASNSRKKDPNTGQYVDGDTTFLRATIWGEAAENVAESLEKGTRVIASGVLKQSSWEKNGEKKTSYQLDVDEIGPGLRFATAKVSKAGRRAATQQGGGWGNSSSDW